MSVLPLARDGAVERVRDPSERLPAGAVVLLPLMWRLRATRAVVAHVAAVHGTRRSQREEGVPAVAPATPG